MPQFPKPFFRASRQTWYVQIHGKQVNLGIDRDKAFAKYYVLMHDRVHEVRDEPIVVVLESFLDWAQQNTAPRTFDWYCRHLQAFLNFMPATMRASQVTPNHFTQLFAKHPRWSSTTRAGLCRAVQRAFNWAEEEKLIERSPIAKMKKPRSKTREVIISQAEFDHIVELTRSEHFRDVLVTAWETGARPQEIIRVEARHVDLANGRWLFPIEESKGKKRPRIVYLSEPALHVTRMLVLRHPTGPLFVTKDGTPWNKQSLACAFGRIQVALGFETMKELGITLPRPRRFNAGAHAPAKLAAARKEQEGALHERRKALWKLARKHGRKYCLYHFRHSWATRALQRGVDPLTVAILMGHSDPSTLAKVYQHVAHDPEYMQGAARRATGAVG
jgi:integrase